MAQLQVKQVSYQIEEKQLLKEISFEVQQGEFVTLTGPSGSGKSTLLKIIASLVTATSGEIYLDGQAQTSFLLNEYRQEVSYCFQQPSLFGKTVRDNLIFPFTVRNQPFDEELALHYLQKVALASFLDKKVTELSGGEKQRIALIRNLLFLPKILLLDEVTVGLDAENKQIIYQLLHFLQEKGVTLIQITHDAEEISQASRILVLEKGVLR
ncbi:ATP-binding cassette domain-containing protein [Enterococcus saccharolyticus]|uniref:ABC transporter ATP-binding protein n=1 Tax=Enterococcus saccharolyticus TaxID=41997 RepID=UPI001E36142B|nr:ATP-binding cassette domain-containing protein [Enterococcus saccharolyticus]MCD5001996.1 ATP-binding cassette domain-containing protein [Enterococcus saccharolyticus]